MLIINPNVTYFSEMGHHTKTIIPVSIPTVPQLRPVLEAISRGSSPIPPEQVLFSLTLSLMLNCCCYRSLVLNTQVLVLTHALLDIMFLNVLFSCWRQPSSKGTKIVLTFALSPKEALREAASSLFRLHFRPRPPPACCNSTLWRSAPALSPSNTAIAMAGNPTCLPCILMVWDPIHHQVLSLPPTCWSTTAAAASLMITSWILQTLSLWHIEGSLQLATTLTLLPRAQMGLSCSAPLLTPTVQCLWVSPNSLLSLVTPHLLCRVSTLEVPHLPFKVTFKETTRLLFKGCCQETLQLKAYHHETSPLQVWSWEMQLLKVFVILVPRAWPLRSLLLHAMTTFQKPSWHLSMREGRWRRERGCCVSKPDPRLSMAQIWGSMISPADAVCHQKTSDLQAPVDQLPQLMAPESSSWVQGSLVMAWGPHLSPAPPRHLCLVVRKPPPLLCRAAAAAACRLRAGLPLRLTALLTDRLNPSLPLHPPCRVYPPPPLPLLPLPMPPIPQQNDPRLHIPLRVRTQLPWEAWNKKIKKLNTKNWQKLVWITHLCSVSLRLHSSRILCK